LSPLLAAARLDKKGASREPVVITSKPIAQTFWGRSWCTNMERYSDFYSRLGRGRSYVRSGAVLDLRIDYPHLSCGVGARYDTPVGPVRLDAAPGSVGTTVQQLTSVGPVTRTSSCSCTRWMTSASAARHLVALVHHVQGARSRASAWPNDGPRG